MKIGQILSNKFKQSHTNIFSIIIPVYNGEDTIERTLASLISNKDYIKEVIIVNDKSTDGTLKKIREFQGYGFFPIYVYSNVMRRGPGYSRKVGIEYAKAPWITFVDADDCLTASSLRYVYDHISDNDDLVLVHSKTIYYESGSFVAENVAYSDTSCGGNFYRREYLIENNLYPHDDLFMSEDEYFNEKVMYYISYCDKTDKDNLGRFDYPVYEVHHDIDDGLSFALDNWSDYCCKYHLLYKQYLTDYFIEYDDMKDILYEDYINNFIFCFFLCEGLVLDDDVEFEMEDGEVCFREAIEYFERVFKQPRQKLIYYYYNNQETIDSLLESAFSSVGFEFENHIEFGDFISNL